MSTLDEVKPTVKQRVIDLVSAAGIDVSDWGKFAGGEKRAASNPRYCYEWSFLKPDNRGGQTESSPYSPYGFSIRTSENFRKSWSNVATGVSSARAAAASKQSTK